MADYPAETEAFVNRDKAAVLSMPQGGAWDLGMVRAAVSDHPHLLQLLDQAEGELNQDQRQRVSGILSYTEASKARMLDAMTLASAAKRRMWAAQDSLEQCRRELAHAEAAATVARRDFEETREQLRSFWDLFFRPEVEAAPTTEDVQPPAQPSAVHTPPGTGKDAPRRSE